MPYTLPTATELKTRYPKFAAVADATVTAVILDASRSVDQSWFEEDYQPAIMALAAHMLVLEGLGADVAAQLQGFKSLTVGPLQLVRDEGISAEKNWYLQTGYGQRYWQLLLANKGGPRVVTPGVTLPQPS